MDVIHLRSAIAVVVLRYFAAVQLAQPRHA